MRFRRFFLVLLTFYLLGLNKVLAQSNQNISINYPIIKSDSELYPVKRSWEKILSFFIFPKNLHADYNTLLLKERLAELKYAAEKRLLSEIEKSSNRFATQAGVTVEELQKLNNSDKFNKTNDDFKIYKKILADLRDLYEANSSYWMLVQQDIDTLNILSSKQPFKQF